MTVQVVEVSQFFDYKNMTWQELTAGKEKGVLPSVDKKVFLWTEIPKIKNVNFDDELLIGHVWLMNDKGKPKVFRANYDTSD
jgi:hypothetical protein